MARLLGVSRSGYYRWRAARAAGPGAQARQQAVLDVRVRALHAASDRVYGAPRIIADLHREGRPVNVKTVPHPCAAKTWRAISPAPFDR